MIFQAAIKKKVVNLNTFYNKKIFLYLYINQIKELGLRFINALAGDYYGRSYLIIYENLFILHIDIKKFYIIILQDKRKGIF